MGRAVLDFCNCSKHKTLCHKYNNDGKNNHSTADLGTIYSAGGAVGRAGSACNCKAPNVPSWVIGRTVASCHFVPSSRSWTESINSTKLILCNETSLEYTGCAQPTASSSSSAGAAAGAAGREGGAISRPAARHAVERMGQILQNVRRNRPYLSSRRVFLY